MTTTTSPQVKKLVAGEMVWTEGEPVEKVVLVAKGKLAFVNTGMYALSEYCAYSPRHNNFHFYFWRIERFLLLYISTSFTPILQTEKKVRNVSAQGNEFSCPFQRIATVLKFT